MDRPSHPAGEIWALQTHIHLCSVGLIVSDVYQLISFTLLLGFFLQKGKGTSKVIRSCFYLGIPFFLPREHPGKFLHLASCTVSPDVTTSLTKGDRRVWFGQECLPCYLTFWPINVPGAQVQGWITHTFSLNLQAVEGKEHRKFNSKL